MSLLLAYTFNDNNVSSFADFSGNKQTGSGTLTSIVAGQNYGYAANFGATNNYITVTPTNFSGISAITVFTSLYLNSLPTSPGYWYIINQSGSFNVQINYSGNVVFSVFNPGLSSYVTVTSATAISATTWTTIGCVWDGSTLYTYINGIQDANTAACTSATTNNNAVYIGNDTSADTVHTFNGKIDNIEVRSEASIEADMINLTLSPGGMEIKNVFHNFSTGDLIADDSVTQQAVVTWVVDTANFYCYPLSNFAGTYKKIGNIYQSSRQYFTQLSQDFNGNGDGQMKIMFPITGFADYSSPANTYTYDKNGYEGLATLVAGSTAATATAGDNSTKLATTAYVDGKTVSTTGGGTGIDSHSSTGIAQVNSGTWSVNTALASGTTATTQTPGDNSTKVATTAYTDTAQALDLKVSNNLSDINNAATSRTNLGVGYTLSLFMGVSAISTAGFNPANSTTYYGVGWTATGGLTGIPAGGVYIPASGTIKTVSLNAVAFQVASANNNTTIYIRKNNTTDYVISTILNLNSFSFYQQITGLSIPVTIGDYIVMKWLTQSSGTAPQGVSINMQCFIQ